MRVPKTKKRDVTKASSRPAPKRSHKAIVNRKAEKAQTTAGYKATTKARQLQRKKGADRKHATIEAHLGAIYVVSSEELSITTAPASSPKVIVSAPSNRPEKVAEPSINFDDCVAVVPAIPSLPAIALSENVFAPLEFVKEDEEVASVMVETSIPRESLIACGVRVVKKLVAKAAKFLKSAIKAARNMVSC
jgi:hypothetical protein